jgi:small subunit ribosomal protein S8e
MITQDRSKRKVSGGRYKQSYTKRVLQMGNKPILTKVGTRVVKLIRGKGGFMKAKLASCDVVNVYDPKTKKFSKVKLKAALENSANRHYVRRNILTKGTIVDTEKGKARITSRPGQEGTINAVLIFD